MKNKNFLNKNRADLRVGFKLLVPIQNQFDAYLNLLQ